jgi:hypothetical protein
MYSYGNRGESGATWRDQDDKGEKDDKGESENRQR